MYRSENTITVNTSESERRNPALELLERIVWTVLLISLAFVAFVPGRIDQPAWRYPTLALLFVALIAILMRVQTVRQLHFRSALVVVSCLLATQLWLVLQAVLPFDNGVHEYLFPQAQRPAWFVPTFKWSLTPQASLALALRELVVLAAFVSVVLLCTTTARVKSLLWLLTVVGVVHAGLAYSAWVSGTHLVDSAALDGHFEAMRGLFINRNHFGSFLLICSLGSLVPLLYRLYQLRALSLLQAALGVLSSSAMLHVLILLGLAFCIVMSESRAGFAGLLIIASVLVFGFGVKFGAATQMQSFDRILARFLVFLAALVMALVGIVLLGEGVVERFSQSYTVLGERPLQWWITLIAIAERPLIGYGGGAYATVFEIYRDGYALREIVYDQAHNEYLHVLLEQGLIGLILFLGFFAVTIWQLLASLGQTRSRHHHALLLALLAVTCAVLFQALFDFNLQIVRIRVFFFVSLAMVFVLARSTRHSTHSS